MLDITASDSGKTFYIENTREGAEQRFYEFGDEQTARDKLAQIHKRGLKHVLKEDGKLETPKKSTSKKASSKKKSKK